MSEVKLQLEIVTQEKKLVNLAVDKVTVPTVTGEVTILPHHIGLFTKLHEGVLKYWQGAREEYIAIFGGFMDVSPKGKITILADAAVRAEDIDVAKVERAKEQAEKDLKEKRADVDFVLAEAALRKAHLELQAARKHRTRTAGKTEQVS